MAAVETSIGDSRPGRRLRRELRGEVSFDPLERGRYSTDASVYQIQPLGVIVPRDAEDVRRTLQIANDEGIAVLPRGAGTSQGGQAIGEALVLDTRKYLREIGHLDLEQRTVEVEPGVVLDRLNEGLREHGLFFPVDVATSSRATLGGMAGNNSAGARSIRYGLMADNVLQIEALLADGRAAAFGPVAAGPDAIDDRDPATARLLRALLAIYQREEIEISRRTPRVIRHVAGYNLAAMGEAEPNPARVLVGSEGTLAFFTRIKLQLQRLPEHTVLAACHFSRFADAMRAVQHIVELRPSAVELIDRTLLDLARRNRAFRSTVAGLVRGSPEALLVVEFAEATRDRARRGLDRLEQLLSDLSIGQPVVRAETAELQRRIWGVRKAGLNIVMSRPGDTKPVSFIEDCAVPLAHLEEYTTELRAIFRRHGVDSTWYAHASVGCLHVRPSLNLKVRDDVSRMREIATEAHELVRRLRGSHSGEHGDGIVRSEFLESMLGPRLVQAFAEIKRTFDPNATLNPGKIVDPPAMDDRSLFRYRPGHGPTAYESALDWTPHAGFDRAVEMCNNNGACLKSAPGVMCPSYRATLDERDSTRGRANSLRLALTGQLGDDALSSPGMYATMDLCIGCKACRRECPTGVDMARMKVEFLSHWRRAHGLPLRDRLIAYLPRYAPFAARIPALVNWSAELARGPVGEAMTGLTAARSLPRWRRDRFELDEVTRPPESDSREPDAQLASGARPPASAQDRRVALFTDTFNRYFEPDNARAAVAVLRAAGREVIEARAASGRRPLCCGRTFLNAGLVDQARAEMQRLVGALAPLARAGVPIVGLEPSCLLTLRDELASVVGGDDADAVGSAARLLDELLGDLSETGQLSMSLRPVPVDRLLVHGHCHRKAFGAMPSLVRALEMIPEVHVETIPAGCCGMAGSFGYEREHYDVSMRIGELGLLPAARAAEPGAWIVADGTSCRSQIEQGASRAARHPAVVLAAALATAEEVRK